MIRWPCHNLPPDKHGLGRYGSSYNIHCTDTDDRYSTDLRALRCHTWIPNTRVFDSGCSSAPAVCSHHRYRYDHHSTIASAHYNRSWPQTADHITSTLRNQHERSQLIDKTAKTLSRIELDLPDDMQRELDKQMYELAEGLKSGFWDAVQTRSTS